MEYVEKLHGKREKPRGKELQSAIRFYIHSSPDTKQMSKEAFLNIPGPSYNDMNCGIQMAARTKIQHM